ncbi:PadR family transcriptional regulator [Labedella endophytica]|uniref:PadR family transcriptional regulator n=1 Tax=Labedella endophytica TaxID=1523160 RepID=A0A3S0XWB6_9MICO|nr:PadR family transcriptional regulator [Labedella endophytica]RUQ96777.1 PadR family transcriptional regulator [Labedella endophytica]
MPGLPPNAYALLGLLVFDSNSPDSEGMTGYELKQRADFTLRYYWVSPAMSQIYSELRRLSAEGFVSEVPGEGPTRYRATPEGAASLQTWLFQGEVGFPVLKHPVALRLLMGRLSTPEQLQGMLAQHLDDLADRRADLQGVRDMLGDDHARRYAALVADWGLAYYDSETQIVTDLRSRLDTMD